jgi:glycosyltransferase involved in cell wall biosynthesis
VKLIIQIPCYNEQDHLAATVADLPRSVAGIDQIEVLVIDDGSSDATTEVARAAGVHHIVRVKQNRGLSNAFMRGMDAALRLGADVLVNTDADNQYRGRDIPALVAPIVQGRADMVIGDRQTDSIEHFSSAKRALQRWGSRLVRTVSATTVADSPSGFRAFNRAAMARLFVHNRFSYTIETVIQAGRSGLAVQSVKIGTNPKTRESRLFKSLPQYLRRAGPVIFRAYAMYRPVQTFMYVGIGLFAVGSIAVGRFLVLRWLEPHYSGHTQSLVLGVGCIILAFLVGLVTLLSELLAANRRLLEELLTRVRRLDAELPRARTIADETMESTGARPWTEETEGGSRSAR